MLDCPEQIQTSPIRMSVTVISLLPLTVISNGPPASIGSSLAIHFPAASATAFAFCFPSSTKTFSPGSAVPQTGIFIPRWKTAWFLNGVRRVTSASAETTQNKIVAKIKITFFMRMGCSSYFQLIRAPSLKIGGSSKSPELRLIHPHLFPLPSRERKKLNHSCLRGFLTHPFRWAKSRPLEDGRSAFVEIFLRASVPLWLFLTMRDPPGRCTMNVI